MRPVSGRRKWKWTDGPPRFQAGQVDGASLINDRLQQVNLFVQSISSPAIRASGRIVLYVSMNFHATLSNRLACSDRIGGPNPRLDPFAFCPSSLSLSLLPINERV